MARKRGNSLENKTVLAIVRDSMLAKPHTMRWHVLSLSFARHCQLAYPLCDWKGNPWPSNSREHALAGTPFARHDGWRCAFAAFKGDLEARVMVHKMVRNYMANMICEHCPAGKLLSYADFRRNAPWTSVRFSHQEFLDLNPPNRQSAWTNVPGWTKDRNLED
jgi:hypothetical protein